MIDPEEESFIANLINCGATYEEAKYEDYHRGYRAMKLISIVSLQYKLHSANGNDS
jgi:hypothetical protein